MSDNFDGALIKNGHKITKQRSIIICGVTRGGTSFAASVFVRLGVPFARGPRDKISRRYEHIALKEAFQAHDSNTIRQIAAQFSEKHQVWGWKLPSIQRRMDAVAETIPNPHFVVLFKEPLSVAVRKSNVKGVDTLRVLQKVLNTYQHLAELAHKAQHPMLLVSYDRAMSNLPAFLLTASRFAGISSFDENAVIESIREDGRRYFKPDRDQ